MLSDAGQHQATAKLFAKCGRLRTPRWQSGSQPARLAERAGVSCTSGQQAHRIRWIDELCQRLLPQPTHERTALCRARGGAQQAQGAGRQARYVSPHTVLVHTAGLCFWLCMHSPVGCKPHTNCSQPQAQVQPSCNRYGSAADMALRGAHAERGLTSPTALLSRGWD